MYTKIKIPLIVALILLLIFSVFNYFGNLGFEDFKLIAILIIAILIFFFLPRQAKLKYDGLSLGAIGACIIVLLLNVRIFNNRIERSEIDKVFKEYGKLDCADMKKVFEIDLKKDELKYFSFGFVYPFDLSEKLEKIGIRNYHQGCFFSENLLCYNKLVEEYLKKNKNISIANAD